MMGNPQRLFFLLCCLAVIVHAQIQFSRPNIRNRPNRRRPTGNRHQGNQGIGFGGPVNNFPRQTPRPVKPVSSNKEPRGCNCLEASKCPSGFGQAATKCVTDNARAQEGICCISQNVVASRIGPSKSATRTIAASDVQVRTAFQMGNSFLNELDQAQRTRLRGRKFVKRGTPARAHAYFFQRSKEAKEVHRMAYTLAFASQEIAKEQGLTSADAFFSLQEARIRPPSQAGITCPSDRPTRCDANAKYRTIDGTCNNLRKPLIGGSASAFGRLSPPLYEDGIMDPRVTAADGKPLPLARDVSNTVLLAIDAPNKQLTLNVMQVSQFVDHDITLTPFMDMDGEAIECCEDGREVSPLPEGCFNVPIPEDDLFFIPRRQRCMNFVRSMLAPMEGCFMGPVEQLNALTHWADASMIYGSNQEENDRIVDERTGFMSMSKNRLPPINLTIDCEPRKPGSPCFAAGDSRVTEQPALTAMHTVWIREHNRIAAELRKFNPRWSAKQLFEETRRIVIAQVQHIMYSTWLPIIIGDSMVRSLGIETLRSGFRNGYNPNVDPTISNEFATAAFRYGHSMVQGIYRLITASGRSSQLRLRETFNDPELIMKDPDLVDNFVRGLSSQQNQNQDGFISEELSNHLFQTPGHDFGMDLMSLNIQRGRDHAIATYSQMREAAGLGKARSFVDLTRQIPPDRVRRLQSVYRNVEDIDLFAGGIVEKPIGNGLLGPTFANIVGRQFQRLLEADRFFYDRGGQPGSFTAAQLQEIRKSNLARIFCDNTETIQKMQPDAFKLPKGRNDFIPCGDLPKIDLSLWQGERAQ